VRHRSKKLIGPDGSWAQVPLLCSHIVWASNSSLTTSPPSPSLCLHLVRRRPSPTHALPAPSTVPQAVVHPTPSSIVAQIQSTIAGYRHQIRWPQALDPSLFRSVYGRLILLLLLHGVVAAAKLHGGELRAQLHGGVEAVVAPVLSIRLWCRPCVC
jgi:hypothetical protein